MSDEQGQGARERLVHVAIWREIVDRSGVKEQAMADALGMSFGYFSKISNGKQGDLLGLVLELGGHLEFREMRREFIQRLAEQESLDLVTQAAEKLAAAAMQFLRVSADAVGGQKRMARVDGARKLA